MMKERESFINFVEERDNLFREENGYFSVVWENCLTSDYWKSWKERIMTLPSEKVGFFEDRVLELRSRVLWIVRSYRKNEWNDGYTRELVGINEREFENVTEKEFYSNKPKNGVRKLTVKEISDILETFGSEQQGKSPKNWQKSGQRSGDIVEVDNSNAQHSINRSSFAPFLISGVVLLAIVGLILFLFIRRRKRVKIG